MFSLIDDLQRLRRKIAEAGSVAAVLIDPISAYLGVGKVDTYRGSDVRAVLGPLKALAEDMQIAVIGIMHFNKKVDITNVHFDLQHVGTDSRNDKPIIAPFIVFEPGYVDIAACSSGGS